MFIKMLELYRIVNITSLSSGCRPSGTADRDTVCHVCPNGTFSDSTSAHLGCREHQSCDAAGQRLLLKGSTWHDSLCMSCQQQESPGKTFMESEEPGGERETAQV